MESVIDASADIYGAVACACMDDTYIHTESGWRVQDSGMHATISSGFVLTAEDERGS